MDMSSDEARDYLRAALLGAVENREGKYISAEDVEYGSGDPELADDIARMIGRFWD